MKVHTLIPHPEDKGRGRARHSSEFEVSQGYMLRPDYQKERQTYPIKMARTRKEGNESEQKVPREMP